MRRPAAAVLAAGLLAAPPLPWSASGSAVAQVAVNPGALDALPPQQPPRPAPRQTQPAQPPAQHQRPAPQHPAPQQQTRPATPPPAPPARPVPPPAVPPAPPPAALVPPPVAVPTQRSAPPPPVPVAPDAPGEAAAIPGGTRVTFGPDRSDLNPATEAALRGLARSLKADDSAAVNVLAYAAGGPDDPSTPRRLSLARALAARAVLIHEGIVSTRIYVRALGATGGDGPADRVDLTVTGGQPRPTPAATGSATAGPTPPVPTATGPATPRPAAPGPAAR